MATTPNYEVNYDDERLVAVKTEEQSELDKFTQTYDDQIAGVQGDFDKLIQNAEDWKNQQTEIQNQQTDLTLQQIEQQKAQAHKDYLKEQSGAYVDWQKQSNQYGANAEQMASQGMTGTGFSESSQVAMYNQYQNRVTTGREVYAQAVLNYDNAMKEARLQNSSILAEIAQETLQKQLELGLQATQYKNQLLLEKANKELEIKNMYHNQWMDVLNQINTENEMAFRQDQFEEEIRQFNQTYELQKAEFDEQIRQWTAEMERLKARDKAEDEQRAKELQFKIDQAKEDKRRWEAEMAEKKRQFQLQFNAQYGPNGGTKTSFGGAAYQTAKNHESQIRQTASKPTGSNMESVEGLYGPISPETLAGLLATGQVVRYKKNGQWYYKKNTSSPTYNRMKNMGLSK